MSADMYTQHVPPSSSNTYLMLLTPLQCPYEAAGCSGRAQTGLRQAAAQAGATSRGRCLLTTRLLTTRSSSNLPNT